MKKRDLVEYFETIGFHPSQKLGQNFLIDGNLCNKLVDFAKLEAGGAVVEVGPGMGMITEEILDRGCELYAVEKDDRLCKYLRHRFLAPKHEKSFHLIHADAVETPLAGVQDVGTISVIANPPFAITGPWLAAILDHGFPKCMSLLLQKEAVERLTATAGSKKFGVLSMRLGAAYEVVNELKVPAECFYPAPTIESRIVVFERKNEPVSFHPTFLSIVQELFTQRRKQLGGRLRKLLTDETLKDWETLLVEHDYSFQNRPEEIPTEIWCELDLISRFNDSN